MTESVEYTGRFAQNSVGQWQVTQKGSLRRSSNSPAQRGLWSSEDATRSIGLRQKLEGSVAGLVELQTGRGRALKIPSTGVCRRWWSWSVHTHDQGTLQSWCLSEETLLVAVADARCRHLKLWLRNNLDLRRRRDYATRRPSKSSSQTAGPLASTTIECVHA